MNNSLSTTLIFPLYILFLLIYKPSVHKSWLGCNCHFSVVPVIVMYVSVNYGLIYTFDFDSTNQMSNVN